jgi:hypothetical protein
MPPLLPTVPLYFPKTRKLLAATVKKHIFISHPDGPEKYFFRL